jgi:hypothetical protein
MRERACVMQLDQDFIAGGWSVSCFCGWQAETCWDDLLDAEEEYQRHRRSSRPAEPKPDGASQPAPVSRDAVSGAIDAPPSTGLGPDSAGSTDTATPLRHP